MVERPRRSQWGSWAVLIALVVVILFPGFAFPHPATNEAIWLADAEWPLVLLEVAGAVAVYFLFRTARGAFIRMGVGVFLFAAAISLVVGLLVFGNLSNDRFGALLVFPPILGLIGLVGIVVAVAAGAAYRPELLRGVAYGLAFAFLFGVLILTRGASAWLLAPYGFDLLLIVAILGAGIVEFGTRPRLKARG